MKHRCSHQSRSRTSVALFLVLAVALQQSASAFKLPGILGGGGGGQQQTPPSSGKGGNGYSNRPSVEEYTGQVFIIKELDKEKGLYDTFITTGGIQEVKPPASAGKGSNGYNGQPQQQLRPEEDSEYFGVLVTPETVRQFKFPPTVLVNASMSMLLKAGSSRIPWLLVLRRGSYSEMNLSGGGAGTEQPRAGLPFPVSGPSFDTPAAAAATAGMSPNMMQIPQRRRYYAGNQSERPRRAVDFRRQLPFADFRDDEAGRIAPLQALEHELLSTMCYNFARDYYQASAFAAVPPTEPDRHEVYLDVNAYTAAAAKRFEAPTATIAPAHPEPVQEFVREPVPMTVPKRVVTE